MFSSATAACTICGPCIGPAGGATCHGPAADAGDMAGDGSCPALQGSNGLLRTAWGMNSNARPYFLARAAVIS